MKAYKAFFLAYLRHFLSYTDYPSVSEVHDRLLRLARMYPVSLAYISGTESFFARFEFGEPKVACVTACTVNGLRSPEKIARALKRLERPYEFSESEAYASLTKALLDGAGFESHIQRELIHVLNTIPLNDDFLDVERGVIDDDDKAYIRITENLRNVRLYYTSYIDTNNVEYDRVLIFTPSTIANIRRRDLQRHCIELFQRKLWDNFTGKTLLKIDKLIRKGLTYEQSIAALKLLG